MVDLRGFGGSSGCLDWGGPGEQADVAAAVTWASAQPWSTGAVGTYGKSYDAMTGLIATALHPDGLKAVVAQEPVYDDYRYLYGDGMRRENSLATPALYDAIDETPGPLADDPTYNAGAVNDTARPGCPALNWLDQQSDDHTTDYWKARDLIAKVQGSQVPLFITQGLTENNTAPDGTAQFLANHAGPERGWLGPWEHVRGNETCATGDSSTGCNAGNVGRLKMGRAGWYDEVLAFYDQYLKGGPADPYPNFAVQTNDGVWRAEDQWPPADATGYTTALGAGTYDDTAQSTATEDGSGDDKTGVWSVSAPLPYEVHLSGSPTATVTVNTTQANANLVVDVYDINQNGKGPLVARQGSLVRGTGDQKLTLQLMSADWKFAPGHRIAVRVTDNNADWWAAALPTGQTVKVTGGSITLPFLRYERTQAIQGDPGVQLQDYLRSTATSPTDSADHPAPFALPPAMTPPPSQSTTPAARADTAKAKVKAKPKAKRHGKAPRKHHRARHHRAHRHQRHRRH
jgi:predicted acyl esterase